MNKFSLARFLIAAVVLTIIAQLVHGLDGFFAMDYYTNPANASLWSKIMMPNAGPPPASFFYYSIGFGLIGAIIFTAIYTWLKNSLPGNTLSKKGAAYGLIVFLLAGIPGALSMILILNLPLGLIALWTAEDLMIKLFGAVSVAYILK